MTHLLPDAASRWEAYCGEHRCTLLSNVEVPEVYPIAFALALLTLFFLYAVDTLLHSHHHVEEESLLPKSDDDHDHSNAMHSYTSAQIDAFILSGAMTFHAVCDGIAIGTERSHGATFVTLSVAMAFHKLLDGLAVGDVVSRAQFDAWWMNYLLIGTTSLMTPLGIIIGLYWSGDPFTEATLLSIAAGSFIFIPLVEMLPQAMSHKEDTRWRKFVGILFALFGITFMAVLAIWS